jgi:hypothetical protein
MKIDPHALAGAIAHELDAYGYLKDTQPDRPMHESLERKVVDCIELAIRRELTKTITARRDSGGY